VASAKPSGGRSEAAASTFGAAPDSPLARGKTKHVVLLMMEDRSFDHFLGWLPGGDGKQPGLAYTFDRYFPAIRSETRYVGRPPAERREGQFVA
jgi:phospholipase C